MEFSRCWNCMEERNGMAVCPHCGFSQEGMRVPTDVLRPGTILQGKIVVGNMLGRGGFGITYMAFDLKLQMKLIVKEYYPGGQVSRNNAHGSSLSWQDPAMDMGGWEAACEKVLDEAKRIAKIRAIPQIASVRDAFLERANKTAYIVMDYMEGQNLADYVQAHGPLAFSDCANKLLPLLKSLDQVHRQGIIHRNIHPGNLMLSPEGKLYLLDLGTALEKKEADVSSFSAIEQFPGSSEIGEWTDVYALAASLYYCVYGKYVPAAASRMQEDTLDFGSKGRKRLNQRQVAVLRKALAVQRAMRYQSAMDFYIALDSTLSALPLKKAGMLLGIACLLGAAALGAVYFFRAKAWLPTVREMSMSDENIFIRKEGIAMFMRDLDGNLCMVPYDEAEGRFPLEEARVIRPQDEEIEGDGYSYLLSSDSKLYAVYIGGAGKSNYLESVDLDGSNPERILEIQNNCDAVQYVRLSNGKEYIYYSMVLEAGKAEAESGEGDADETAGGVEYGIYRYDIEKGEVEYLLSATDIGHFALHGKYLYYCASREDAGETGYLAYRALLDGRDLRLIDETHNYALPYATEDALYLMQLTNLSGDFSPGLMPCDEDGRQLQEGQGNYEIYNKLDAAKPSLFTENKIFYTEGEGGDTLRSMNLDGSWDREICSGYQFGQLGYDSGFLYFLDNGHWEGAEEEGIYCPSQAYLMREDGTGLEAFSFACRELATEDGLRYQIEDGKYRVAGYEGEQGYVVIPQEIGGCPWDGDTASLEAIPEGITVYRELDIAGLQYESHSDGVILTGYSGQEIGDGVGNIAIPAEIDGIPVIGIGENAFREHAFERLYLPEGIREIGRSAFWECQLKEVIFPDSLQRIEKFAFVFCSLDGEEIRLPEGFSYLGLSAFGRCTPKSIYLPASLEEYAPGFLDYCGGEYIVDEKNPVMLSEDGLIYSKDKSALLAFPYERAGSFTFPDGLQQIAPYAAAGCSIASIVFPAGLEEIGDYAFLNCGSLRNLVIPASVRQIGDSAFEGTGLSVVTIPRDCEIGEEAFGEDVEIRYYAF